MFDLATLLPHPTYKCEALRVVCGPMVVATEEKSALALIVALPGDATVGLQPACLTLIRRPELSHVGFERPLSPE